MALGIGEAGAYPSNAGIAAKWFPDKERATISGLFDSASHFSGTIGPILTGFIVASIGSFNTALMFSAVIGVLGMLSYMAWQADE